MGVYSSEYVEVATSWREGEETEERDKKEQVAAVTSHREIKQPRSDDPDKRYVLAHICL